MADDKSVAAPSVALDAEGKKLQLDAEKAKYVEAIAKAKQGTAEAEGSELKAFLPSIADAPKGEVTLGAKAGAFGPWRAHQFIDQVGLNIANAVVAALAPDHTTGAEPLKSYRVLVVDDPSVLPGDWTSHYVRTTLGRLTIATKAAGDQIDKAAKELAATIVDYTDAEKASATQATTRPGRPRDVAKESLGDDKEAAPEPAAAGRTGAGSGALGAAVELLGLLRTDYTITATSVSYTASEVLTLTAAKLAANNVATEVDAFTTLDAGSPSMTDFGAVLDARDHVVGALAALTGQLAPVAAEVTLITARLTTAEQAWSKAVTDEKPAAVVAGLRTPVDALVAQLARRQAAAAPAQAVISYAKQVVSDVDAAVAALLQAPKDGEAPLYSAAKRDRLDTQVATKRITHVLYVSLDALAADAVTRRSILGTSGRMRFLSAGTASWLLLDADKGTVSSGGQVSLAEVMTFNIDAGSAHFAAPETISEPGGRDSLDKVERGARILVVALIVVLAALGVASALAVLGISV